MLMPRSHMHIHKHTNQVLISTSVVVPILSQSKGGQNECKGPYWLRWYCSAWSSFKVKIVKFAAVKPPMTEPPESGLPLYSGQITVLDWHYPCNRGDEASLADLVTAGSRFWRRWIPLQAKPAKNVWSNHAQNVVVLRSPQLQTAKFTQDQICADNMPAAAPD